MAGTAPGEALKPDAGEFWRTTMLRAGASKVNITPFLGGPMAGYSARDRGSESIHDELYAKALVLDDGGTGVALITTDLIGIHRELAAQVRGLVEASVGLGPDRVWMTGSHTHFGPAVSPGGTEDEQADPHDRSYADVLAAKLTTAVKLAHDRLRPARLGAGATRAEGISYNRRLIRQDGKVEMSLTLPPPYEGLKFGPVDPEVGVLRVEGEADGESIASLINFACHPVSSTDRRYEITADYPGYAMDLIESVEGGTCLFALGCAGNIVPIQRQGRSKRQVGLSLGGCALNALQWIQTTDRVRIRAARRSIELPLRNRRGRGRKTRPTEIQVFWLGDIPRGRAAGRGLRRTRTSYKESPGCLSGPGCESQQRQCRIHSGPPGVPGGRL